MVCRSEPLSHIRTQLGGKLLARRGRGGQQRDGGRRKRGVGYRGGEGRNTGNSFTNKKVILPGTRKKSPTGKGGYSARFGLADNTPRDPNAPKEWWELTDIERREVLAEEERLRKIRSERRRFDRNVKKAAQKAAKGAAEAHCHRHLVERAAVEAARFAGASEEMALRIGKQASETAIQCAQSAAMQNAVNAPETLDIQKSPHLSMQQRRKRALEARKNSNKPKTKRRIGVLERHLKRERTEDELAALNNAYHVARAVVASGMTPEMVGRAAREAAKFVGKDVAIVLGAEASANVVAKEASARGESSTSIRVKARRAALGAGMKALEATHLSTKIAAAARAESVARRLRT